MSFPIAVSKALTLPLPRPLSETLHDADPLKPATDSVDEDRTMFGQTFGKLARVWAQGRAGAAIALQAPFMLTARRQRQNTRTGGPDDDEDDELRRLMPILAAVIAIAVVFGG